MKATKSVHRSLGLLGLLAMTSLGQSDGELDPWTIYDMLDARRYGIYEYMPYESRPTIQTFLLTNLPVAAFYNQEIPTNWLSPPILISTNLPFQVTKLRVAVDSCVVCAVTSSLFEARGESDMIADAIAFTTNRIRLRQEK